MQKEAEGGQRKSREFRDGGGGECRWDCVGLAGLPAKTLAFSLNETRRELKSSEWK